GLADEVAAEFDDDFGLREGGFCLFDNVGEVGADGAEVERLFAREIGNAEAAAEVEELDRSGGVLCQPAGERKALLLGLDDGFGLEVLRAGKEVKALESQPRAADFGEQIGHLFGI